MIAQINALLIGGILSIVHAVFVTCLLRKIIPNKLSPMPLHIISAICMLTMLCVVWLTNVLFDVWLAFTILSFMISSCLFLYGTVYKSLSLRLLLIINSKAGRASFQELNIKVTEVSFAERAEIICSMGLAIKTVEGYQISQQGIHVVNRILRIRKFFGINTKGLYQETDDHLKPSTVI